MTHRLKIISSVSMSILCCSVRLGYWAGASLGVAGIICGAAFSLKDGFCFSFPFCFVSGSCDWCCDWDQDLRPAVFAVG